MGDLLSCEVKVKVAQLCPTLCNPMDYTVHGILQARILKWVFLVAQMEENLPEMQKTWVRSLGWEDPLEKGNTTHSSILAWRIPWTF